ncbi:MAG: 4Fe-4S ferredoxin [Eggerthellaceae bacterium]|nr:4Fe-4S ferredoxin [Eggerthellaceae bacterium]
MKGFSYSYSCNHCNDPACLKNCPAGAIYKADDGTVIQDQNLCVGCKMRVMSCPYGHPQFIKSLGVSGKCDGCYGIRQSGNLPACVAGCPNRALDFGDVEALKEKYGPDLVTESIVILPSNFLTHPNILRKAKESALTKTVLKSPGKR